MVFDMKDVCEQSVSVKFVVELNGVKRTATTNHFKVVYDGSSPSGALTCVIDNKMFDMPKFFKTTVTLDRSLYGYELKEKVYEHDIVRFSYKGDEYIGTVVDDKSLPLAYIQTIKEGKEMKVPLYRAENIIVIGSDLMGDSRGYVTAAEQRKPEKSEAAGEHTSENNVPESIPSSSSGVYEIYTDGSISDEPAGGARFAGGAYIARRFGKTVAEKEIFLGEETSARAELLAACTAIEDISGFSPQQIVVVTDSQYVVNGAMLWSKGWIRNNWINKSGEEVKNRDLWERLLALKDIYNVTFEWVGKDKEDPLNEQVSIMSHKAASGKRMSA